MVQGGMSVVKFLVFAFNFVFVVCGIALVAVGVVVQQSGKTYTEFLDTKFVTAPTIIITLGVIIFLISFLGCCGALKQNYCMVMTFGALIFLIFIIELAAVGVAYAYKGQLDDLVNKNMHKSLNNTKPDENSIWNDLERSMHCCGVDGPSDYEFLKHWDGKISPYCCDPEKEVERECLKTKAYPEGCYEQMKNDLRGKIGMVAGASVGIAVIEVLGMIFAWCLGSAIKKEYEGV